MKHAGSRRLRRFVLASALLFVLVGLAPASASAPADVASVPSGRTYTQVNIYLIGMGTGRVGCGDQAVPVRRNVVPTTAPLTAALNELLSLHDQYYGQSGLYNALYQSSLSVQNITRRGTTWYIYLAGSTQLGGVCDIPRVEAQLQRTALQFSTVRRAYFYINGVPIKKALSLQ